MFRQKANLASYITEYCVRIAAMYDEDGNQIVKPQLCFSNDDTAFLVESEIGSKSGCRGSLAAMAKLKGLNQSVKTLSGSAEVDLSAGQAMLASRQAGSATLNPTESPSGTMTAQQSALTAIMKIRPTDKLSPILQPPSRGKSVGRKCDKRGVKVLGLSGGCEHKLSVVTLTEKKAFESVQDQDFGRFVRNKLGFIHYRISDTLDVIVRTPDMGEVSEADLAMYKKITLLNPKMEAVREIVIKDYIESHNQIHDLLVASGKSVENHLRLDRASIDLKKFTILSLADGCGCELNAARKLAGEITTEEDLQSYENSELVENQWNDDLEEDSPELAIFNETVNTSTLRHQPEHMIDCKITNKMTQNFQLQDVCAAHKTLKLECKSNKHSFNEIVDDQKIPLYSDFCWAICERHFPDITAKRTFYKLLINFELKASIAFSKKNYFSGAMVCGHGSTDFLTFLKGWSGFSTLKPADYAELERIGPLLVEIARCCGSIPRDLWESLMMRFIHEKHVDALSDIALQTIAIDYLKKNESERPLCQQGAVIINSPARLESCRQKALARREETIKKRAEDELKDANREIVKAAEILRRERSEATKREKNQRDLEMSDSVRLLFNADIESSEQENYKPRWNDSKFVNVQMLHSAYRVFIPIPPDTHSKSPKRIDLLSYLLPILEEMWLRDPVWEPVVQIEALHDEDSDEEIDDDLAISESDEST
jgi:hypothetical protein